MPESTKRPAGHGAGAILDAQHWTFQLGVVLFATGEGVRLTLRHPGDAGLWLVAAGLVLLVINAVMVFLRRFRKEPEPEEERGAELKIWAEWYAPIDRPVRGLLATLCVYNVPNRPNAPTAKVVAHVSYTDTNNRAISRIGRWTHEPHPEREGVPAEQVEIPPGVQRWLELAIGPQGSEDWYAIDATSAFRGYTDSSDRLALPVVIGVALVGNVHKSVVVCLRHEDGPARYAWQISCQDALSSAGSAQGAG
jgi:hypothetical protein